MKFTFRGAAAVLLLPLASALIAGCAMTATDLPLPGGGISGETYQLTAIFDEALNLPFKAQVKLNGVRVGQVTEIRADDYTAKVTFKVSESVKLPTGTTAELRQATPLGDVFVSLNPPKTKSAAPTSTADFLVDGQTIGPESTAAAATVEDLLGALSMLVNGGGLNQLGTIVREGNLALEGHGEQFQHLLGELNTTVTTLNRRTGEIDRVLDSAASLSALAARRRATIDSALRDFTPAIKVLIGETDRFTRAMQSLGRLSQTTDQLAVQAGDDLVAVVQNLGPILDGFADLKGKLAPTLHTVLEFGEVWAIATKGEAITGDARITGVANIPGLDGTPPGPEDAARGAASVLASLARLISELQTR